MNERIKELRQYFSLTQQKFADRLNMSRNFIAQIEIGSKVPSDRTIKDICKEFNADEEWLRTGKGDMLKNEDKDFGAICAEIGANDENAKNALLKYAELTPEDKKLFWDFVEKFLK